MTEYGRDRDAAEFLGLSPETLRRKVREGIFVEGVHFTKPPGMRRRWIRRALAAFIERENLVLRDDVIPLIRGRRVA